MFEREKSNYEKLNEIAEIGATVIFGTDTDTEIPISEISKAFGIDTNIYNRSIQKIGVENAADYYNALIAPIAPNRVIIHIGCWDTELFANDATEFDNAYRKLIACIRLKNSNCNIGLLSFRNPQKDEIINEINKHIRMLAESENCEFEDISVPRVWNPIGTKYAISFAYAMGLPRKSKDYKSLYDLAKFFV